MTHTNPQMLPPWWNDGLHGLPADPNGKAAFSLRETNGAIFMEDLKRNLGSLTDNERKAYEWAKTFPIDSYKPIVYAAALPALRAGYLLPELKVDRHRTKAVGLYVYTKNDSIIVLKCDQETKYNEYISDKPDHIYVLKKWWSQPNGVLHELGHAIADQAGGHNGCRDPRSTELKKYCSELGAIKNTRTKKLIQEYVSKYGATKWCEFDAEVISGILYGKKYPKEIIDLLPNFPDERFIKIKKQGTSEA